VEGKLLRSGWSALQVAYEHDTIARGVSRAETMREPAAFLQRAAVLTFDCYGTLIDWETGLLDAIRRVLGPKVGKLPSGDALLEEYARHESRLQAGPYLPYREILRRCIDALGAVHRVDVTGAERDAFAASVAEWPPFGDSTAALTRLATHYRLGVITNCDDDLFESSRRRLGIAFDWVVTAQRAGRYKPDRLPFGLAIEEIGLPLDRIVHVAQSLHHDHVPAKRLGLATVWVDRRHDRPGFGATPPATAEPDLTVPDLASLVRLVF
jgi:2-haloacid dehalogenase